ncbi:MAG: pyruvate ferredoxin oxidoreductase [Nanoarchaeota archaeon]|nr:pyruvate ferredoxin oxidoreductase [Nanoarchaeota archaeon]MBU1004307.1 pyruvate ferredoxin oxidoreductase [Nanoarchaeota archaeon]MBU1945475.1 pyruvate ferredoxin oxidoreductase [Nanoarchaeota archaeon]
MNYKELALKLKTEKLVPGHRSCSGCGFPQIVRAVLASTDKPLIAASATGCLEVTTTIYPFTSWNIPFIHSAFENSAATISGVEAAYNALKRRGKIKNDIQFVAFGGDGGTYDIGLQSLSGALERGHDFLYVCYDNEAYMNTGIQRSSATPYGASTTTAPAGKKIPGKQEFRKDFAKICVAHNIPYVAQASLSNIIDLTNKAQKAFSIKGPKVLLVLQPCTLGWKYPMDKTVEIAKLAVETKFWPLYEVENGKYKLTYKPAKDVPVIEFLKTQGRFKHLLKPENQHIVDKIQENVNSEWDKLVKLSE